MYDEYMTPADRAACPPELQEMLSGLNGQAGGACRFPSLAMVYAPVQEFTGLYAPAEGLSRGTIFAGLDKPLLVGGGRK